MSTLGRERVGRRKRKKGSVCCSMKRLEMFARRLLAFQFYAASGIGMSKVLLAVFLQRKGLQ